MKVSVVLAFLTAAVASVHAELTAEDQAIWIDRHNYFRTTGLPWSAGDMHRIGWSADLAATAASTAEGCAASTAAGVNVFQSTASNSSSVIDEAIQSWVVETSMSTLSTLPQPGAVGVDVGTGVYNSYSQVLWASTTSVGCATAGCNGGDLVVCNYSPAGNDGSSPWYVHAETASDCPSGTTASAGLCIVEGDAANEQIAAIPAGKLTYEVYPAYVADMQTVLIEAARATASGSTTAPTATTAAPTATSAPTTTSSESSGSSNTSTKQTATSSSGSDASTATKTGKTTSSDSGSESSAATKTGKTTTSSDSSSDASAATKTGKTTTSSQSSSSSSTATKKGKTTTSSSSSDESAPGTVKASSDTGSTFTNQASTTTESPTTQTSGSTTTASSPSTASTESTTTSSGASTSVSTQSSTEASGGISAAGMAGMIVLAVVGVAALGVVTSYKRNQKRQREIMRDGGIRLI